MSADVEKVVQSIKKSVDEHDPKLDSALYNGGTVLALAASIGATSFVWTDDYGWVPRLLAGVAAFLIGIERALGFGQRWRYHRTMRATYETILLRLEALPDDAPDRADRLAKILDDLDAVRRADEIPTGSGIVTSS